MHRSLRLLVKDVDGCLLTLHTSSQCGIRKWCACDAQSAVLRLFVHDIAAEISAADTAATQGGRPDPGLEAQVHSACSTPHRVLANQKHSVRYP
jgi:hypothetical protein